MNIAFISVLTSGSALNACVGAITLTINDVFNAWVVAKPEDFDEAIADESGQRPLQSQDRHKEFKSLLKENWPRTYLADALNQIDRFCRDCKVPVVVWDEDAVSYVDAHSILWTIAPDRPALRRVEGTKGNIHMGSLFAIDALVSASRQQCVVYGPLMRAIHCGKVINRVLSKVIPLDAAPKLVPPSLKGTYVERDFAAEYAAKPDNEKTQILPPGLKLPGAVPAITLPPAPVSSAIKFPGVDIDAVHKLKLPE